MTWKCWQFSACYQHNATNIFSILFLKPFDIRRQSGARSKWITTTPWNNKTKFQRPIGGKTLPCQFSIPQIARNSLTWLHSSKACRTDTLDQLRWCSTKLIFKRRIKDQFTQRLTAHGLSREDREAGSESSARYGRYWACPNVVGFTYWLLP